MTNDYNIPTVEFEQIEALTSEQLKTVRLRTNNQGETDEYTREAAMEYVADGGNLSDLLEAL